MEDDQVEVPDITETQEQPQTETVAPTKTVKTFWERLDEVFKLNLESQQMRERLEDIMEHFDDTQRINQTTFHSFLFQPDRVAITSSDDITRVTTQPGNLGIDLSGTSTYKTGPYNEQFFSNFRIRLDKGLLNVKSIQMLSCTIPNIVPCIPNYSLGFFYYRLRSLQLCQLPNWSANTPYVQYDTIFYPRTGKAYQATNANINKNPVTSEGYWGLVPNYSAASAYLAPQVVFNVADNTYYRCISVPPINNIPPPNPTYWTPLGTYDNTELYNRGDIVKSTVDNFYYVCIGYNIIGQEPSTSVNFNKLDDEPTAPNYFDLTPDFINVIYLNPTNGYTLDMNIINPQTYNRRFIDYDDLLQTINLCATLDKNCCGTAPANTLTFSLTRATSDPTAPIFFQVQKVLPPANRLHFIIPCGYADPNISTFVSNIPTILNQQNRFLAPIFAQNFVPEYTLNSRLGFTWNGSYTNPYLINPYTNFAQSCAASLYFFMRPSFIVADFLTLLIQPTITANTSADMVYTSCVRVYGDFVFGSTQDSEGKGGLLSIVPVNTTNNAVGFYQNNFNNPLLKVPKLITEIGISMTDDQGQPYYLPNSATVLLELAVTYY